MDPVHFHAVLDVAHHTLGRIRERIDGLFVALHGAHVEVQGVLARAGEASVDDPELLAELPALGLGRFLGARLVTWMIAAPLADASALDQLHALLLAAPPKLAPGAFAGMPPLEWQDAAHAALAATHRTLDQLVAAAAETSDATRAAEILEIFCTHAAASFASLDRTAVRARCVAALWACHHARNPAERRHSVTSRMIEL